MLLIKCYKKQLSNVFNMYVFKNWVYFKLTSLSLGIAVFVLLMFRLWVPG